MAANSHTGLFPLLSTRTIPEPFIFQGFGMTSHSMLERLFDFAAPLLMAVARKKKKTSKKPSKRKSTKSVRRTKARPARRKVSVRKPTRKERPKGKFVRRVLPKGKFARKVLLKGKSKFVPPAPKIVEEEEPLPPPVPPIGRAILLVPKDATYVESLHPTFRWLSVGGSTKYEVHWGEDPTLATKYTSISLATETTIPVEKPLHVGALYYWRVRGGNDAGWGPWSPISSFRVLEETP